MNTKINPNLVEEEQLTKIPGIGPKLAERIIAARPFSTVDDLQRVKGIGASNLAQWRESLTLDDTPLTALLSPDTQEDDLPPQPLEEDEAPPEEPEAVGLQYPPMITEQQPDASAVVPEEGQKESFTREQVLLIAGGSSILAFILSIALIIGLLAGLNEGRLRFASPADVNELYMSVTSLTSRLSTQESDLQALRSRVDTLETLGDRMTTAEENIDSLTEEMELLTENINGLKEEVSVLTADVNELQTQTTLFADFFNSMRDLFNQFFPAEGGAND